MKRYGVDTLGSGIVRLKDADIGPTAVNPLGDEVSASVVFFAVHGGGEVSHQFFDLRGRVSVGGPLVVWAGRTRSSLSGLAWMMAKMLTSDIVARLLNWIIRSGDGLMTRSLC